MIFEIDEEKEYTFCYTLDDCKCQSLYDRRVDLSFETSQNGMTVDYCVDGYKMYKGRIHVFSDKLCSCMLESNTIVLHTTVRPAEEICFYIVLEDDFQSENYTKRADDIKKMVLTQGFEGMYVTHREKWNSYMNEGYVWISDEKLDNAYRTAQYSIKAQTTEWSIPVALCDAAWNARYFAFDEYFCCYALLSSNHKNLARRVPEFRNKGLDIAVTRATCGSPFKEKQARYPWETLEDGVEASTPGEWYDHIFHMSHIIMGTCEYYFYTRDREFLEKCYNMVVCCSGFLMDHMVYTLEGGRTVIALGGYIPCPDHRIPPNAKFENVQYYCDKMQNLRV